MSKKTDRALHGPSWAEVILGAFLSLILGVVIGATLLILRPPVIAKEEPKERERGVVYYIEGSKDASKARQAAAKKQAFVAGQSVTVTEEEVNALLAPGAAAPAPTAAKGAEKAKKEGKEAEKEAAAGGGYFAAGAPNVRIREGAVQVGVPVTIGLIDQKVIAQARGGFVKQGDVFVFEPETMYLGSCPVERLPLVAGLVRDKVLAAQSIPEDIVAAWKKLANVTVEGNAVKLTMP